MKTTTASDLIDRSVSHTEIASADWTEELETDLQAECEDSVDAGERHEFWGTTESGSEWRVHLRMPAIVV